MIRDLQWSSTAVAGPLLKLCHTSFKDSHSARKPIDWPIGGFTSSAKLLFGGSAPWDAATLSARRHGERLCAGLAAGPSRGRPGRS